MKASPAAMAASLGLILATPLIAAEPDIPPNGDFSWQILFDRPARLRTSCRPAMTNADFDSKTKAALAEMEDHKQREQEANAENMGRLISDLLFFAPPY